MSTSTLAFSDASPAQFGRAPLAPASSVGSSSSPQPQTDTNRWHNGVITTQPLGLTEVVSTLEATKPLYYGNGAVSNWIGMQNTLSPGSNQQFTQIGIDNNTVQECGEQFEAPVIFAEVEINGSYQPLACFTGYQFGIGSQTYFALTYDNATGQWYSWVNWNNVWENLLIFSTSMRPSAAFASNEVEVEEYGEPYGGIPPQIGTISTTEASLISNGNLSYWFPNFPTQVVVDSGSPYCVSFPTAYTNMNVVNCSPVN